MPKLIDIAPPKPATPRFHESGPNADQLHRLILRTPDALVGEIAQVCQRGGMTALAGQGEPTPGLDIIPSDPRTPGIIQAAMKLGHNGWLGNYFRQPATFRSRSRVVVGLVRRQADLPSVFYEPKAYSLGADAPKVRFEPVPDST